MHKEGSPTSWREYCEKFGEGKDNRITPEEAAGWFAIEKSDIRKEYEEKMRKLIESVPEVICESSECDGKCEMRFDNWKQQALNQLDNE